MEQREANQLIYIGQTVRNLEEAYNLYQAHALQVGFSVRKGRQFFYATKEKQLIRFKEFVCSKEGRKSDDPEGKRSFQRSDSRTDCKAKVDFSISREGVWKVKHLVTIHNHALAKPEERPFLRSIRSSFKKKHSVINSTVDSDKECGVISDTVNTGTCDLSEEAGAYENAALTMGSESNFANVENLKVIEPGDAQSLMDLLQSRQKQDPMFSYAVQIDGMSRLANVFWRDGQSKLDYECFGDVVVLDTTYRTNIYDLICVSFVGINHHWKNIMFGCAFLQDETVSSFQWLLKAFLESMEYRQPKTILTYQNAAMSESIGEIMPNSCHQLCQWRIAKDAVSHLGGLNSNKEFQSLFQKCMKFCGSEEEFENTWNEMFGKFNLKEHTWLHRLYEFRHKWSTAFSKGAFSGGFGSTERNESTSNLLGNISKRTGISEFISAFERMISRWRHKELDDNSINSQSAPPLAIPGCDTLCHASSMYTHRIFKLFEKEYLDGTGGSTSKETKSCGNISYHEVVSGSRPHTVKFDSSNLNVECTCKKFETMNILCSHALRIFNIKGIKILPDYYFLRRWSKNPRSVIYEHRYAGLEEGNSSILVPISTDAAYIVYRNAIMKSFYSLVSESQHYPQAQKIIGELIDRGVQSVHRCLEGLMNSNTTVEDHNEDDEDVVILNPQHGKIIWKSNAGFKGALKRRKQKNIKDKSKKGKNKEDGCGVVNSSLDVPSQIVLPSQTSTNTMQLVPYPMQPTMFWNINSPNMLFTSMPFNSSTKHPTHPFFKP